MPFKKVGKNKYKSPSGRTFTRKQVIMYYSLGGKFPKHKNKKHKYAKQRKKKDKK